MPVIFLSKNLLLDFFYFLKTLITPNFTYFLMNNFASLIDRLALRQSRTQFSLNTFKANPIYRVDTERRAR